MSKYIFGRYLRTLEHRGLLTIPLHFMRTIIIPQKYITRNRYQSVFDHHPLLLIFCVKQAPCFSLLLSKSKDGQQLQQMVNSTPLNYICNPINQIIYQDDLVCAYSQPKYQPLPQQLNSTQFFQMIQIIRILLDCQLEIDFSLDLLGLYDQRVVITNLSSLQPLILDNQWKFAASRYFIQSVNWYYFNDRAIDYLKYLHNAHLPKFCSTFYYQLIAPNVTPLDLIVACDTFLNHITFRP
jgi:hypothetical protein